ncbi:MAG: hypothetical protein ACLU38_09025 [Dysosmobacter sp.]
MARPDQPAPCTLNATTASISDIKEIIADIGTLMAPEGVLLYLDEIQYFNKQQQVPAGVHGERQDHLIASTTENPYFYVYSALLSSEHGVRVQGPCPWRRRAGSAAGDRDGRQAGCPANEKFRPLSWEEGVPSPDCRRVRAAMCASAVNAVEPLCQSALPEHGTERFSPDDGGCLTGAGPAQAQCAMTRRGMPHYDIRCSRRKIHPRLGSGCGGVTIWGGRWRRVIC